MGTSRYIVADNNMKIVQVVSIFLVLTIMTTCDDPDPGLTVFRKDLLAVTNDFRRSQGKGNLSQSSTLERMAQEWADNVAGQDDCHLEHNPNLPHSHAENLAGITASCAGAMAKVSVQGWKKSPGHPALLASYTTYSHPAVTYALPYAATHGVYAGYSYAHAPVVKTAVKTVPYAYHHALPYAYPYTYGYGYPYVVTKPVEAEAEAVEAERK